VSGSSVFRVDLAYDGTGFRGWARQRDPRIRTVEGEVAGVIERILREPVRLSVAGRTDAGVHAKGQVASFVTASRIEPDRVRDAVNGSLGPEIVVRRCIHALAGFDARFSATGRVYRYEIDEAQVPDPFTARYTWHRPGPLSIPAMRVGARHLVGERDFAAFCRHPGLDRSTIRDLASVTIDRRGDRLAFGFRANAFLHQMVRSLVGTLVEVGSGRMDPSEIPRILDLRDRGVAGQVAPPHGLTLERVIYGRRSPVPAPLTPRRSRR